jgi:phosphoribosylanthranilate isomerase
MEKNWISISGVSNLNELDAIKQIYIDEDLDYPLVIGYQCSNKSINLGTRNPRQPFFSDLSNLDKKTQGHGFTTALHYFTSDNNTILPDIEKILLYNINPTLIQFNTLPPSQKILKFVRDMGLEIILKIPIADKSKGGFKVWSGDVVEDVSYGNLNTLLNVVYERRNLIDYAMFDGSHGNNMQLDLSEESLAIRFGKELTTKKDFDKIGLVYAGGIKPDNVEIIAGLLDYYFKDRVSIDAEGGLRKNNILDMGLVRDYLAGYKKSRNS